ncbi:MAG: RNA methyltransferase [Mariniphaga sp.]|jgi:TrmH family RNA methyltransferase|nr:RNA methyltransferase [Mariniphaga sp.]
MIGKNKLKLIKSLAQKKYRLKENSFLAEGDKIVKEVIESGIKVKELFATTNFISENKKHLDNVGHVVESTSEGIKKASLLQQPQNCLAICELPTEPQIPSNPKGIFLYLDGIQDPGNLGTIIRTCDWFGMKYLLCSPDTADVYNPKVIQASMGSFTRVKTIYMPFNALSANLQKSEITVYGTFLEGENIYTKNFSENALVILGNEGRGIRNEVANNVRYRINIPSFNPSENRAESLNVAITAAIICNEFARKKFAIQNEN